MLCQPESPTKKRRLEHGGSAATALSASPVVQAQPKPRVFCTLSAAPEPAAASQPAAAPSLLPEWLHLLRERGMLEAAAELDRLACGGPSPPAAVSPANACLPALSSEGRRMACAVAAGLQLQPKPKLSYKKADVERYTDALERLVTSEQAPAGLEAQHALFRPIDTAGECTGFPSTAGLGLSPSHLEPTRALPCLSMPCLYYACPSNRPLRPPAQLAAVKLAWFLGWWASKERKAPRIPGLDADGPMECSNNAKAAWVKAVLDAAEDGGVFVSTVQPAHASTMPYVAQALLQRLLGRPLFAAAVAKEMQEM